ncbi:phosphatase 2C, partial [Coemansia sp. RSA 2598]
RPFLKPRRWSCTRARLPTSAISTSTNSAIQPRPRLQRSSVPPPLDTENATKDADSTLRTRLLSTLSPTSSVAEKAEPGTLEPLRISTTDDAPGSFASETVVQSRAGAGAGAGAGASGSGVGAGQPEDADGPAKCAHIGVSFSKNRRYRRTMEDAHYHKYDFDGVEGQSFIAIFDGHAGRQAAEWCGDNFADVFLQLKHEKPKLPVPELLNLAFVEADRRLATDVKTHSGCTAVVAYLEITDEPDEDGATQKRQRRTLYCANAGDARAVLSRGGAAVRLTYDHKGDDAHEIERISESGGYVFNGRVNGILAVTRALGDSSLKQFVIGNPFTTETVLSDDDDLLILACDGLWDVCSDQEAVDLVREETDPAHASQALLDYALSNDSMDNITTMVFRLPPASEPSTTSSPASP